MAFVATTHGVTISMNAKSFVVVLRPAPGFGKPETNEIIEKHFQYLKSLHSGGEVRVAGRFSDVLIGLVMIQADTKQDAWRIVNEDPAVKAKVFHAELYEWTIAIG